MSRRTQRFHVPTEVGRAALGELDVVRFEQLDHAYGTGKVGDALHGDVAGSLRRLGDTDPEAFDEALEALYSNVHHQGTIYEATPQAVPFLAAFAADPTLPREEARAVVALLAFIAVASVVETEDGTMGGAFGEDVAEDTRAALRCVDSQLAAIQRGDPEVAELVAAVRELAKAERIEEALWLRIGELAEQLAEASGTRDEPDPREPAAPRWFRHPRFGVGRLVREEHNGLRLCFEGGVERVIVARFVTEMDAPDP